MATSNRHVYKIRLKVNDTVVVRSGKYRGRSGKIVAVHPLLNSVTVEGINVVKKHLKPTQANPQGGIIDITKPISISKVALAHPTFKPAAAKKDDRTIAGKITKVGYSQDKNGKKVRTAKATGKEI